MTDLTELKRKAAPCLHEVDGHGNHYTPTEVRVGASAPFISNVPEHDCPGYSETTWDNLVSELIEAVGMDEHYERHDPEQQDKPWCGNCNWEWPCSTYTALRHIRGEERG